MKVYLIALAIMSVPAFAAKGKVNYQYKKYERFDFSAIDVEGDQGSPGDLSVANRFRKKFRNKIPERKNFNKEMKRALDNVR